MVATAAGIASLIGAGASAGSGIMGMFANNDQQRRQQQITQEQLDLDRQNAANQQLMEALTQQRAVAGSRDSFGTTVQYDPATNSWRTQLGPIPQQAQTAAYNAGIQQNTTDRARQELIDRVATERAARAGPAADAAARDVATFRPMQGNELTGLLTDQATIAARQAYDPLRADVLRSTARTGTAAGPVLAELGRSEAQNLRQSLIDAQVQGMTGVGNINQQRLAALTGKAGATAAEATPNAPQLPTTPISDPGTQSLQSQLTAALARGAATGTAAGATGANAAIGAANTGATGAAGTVPNANSNLLTAQAGLKTLGEATKPGGSINSLIGDIGGLFSGSPGTPEFDLTGSTSQNPAEANYIKQYLAGLGNQGNFSTAGSGTSSTETF